MLRAMFGLGPWEMMMILVVALVFLGPEKLPQVAKSIGKSIRDLQRTANDFNREIVDEIHNAGDVPEPIRPKDVGHETRPPEVLAAAPPDVIAKPAADAIAADEHVDDDDGDPANPYAKIAQDDARWQLEMALEHAPADSVPVPVPVPVPDAEKPAA